MIRQVCIAGSVILLLLASLWNLYTKGLRHDPYAELASTKIKQTQSGNFTGPAMGFRPGWTADIHEKNLFSPGRTYREPKPDPVNMAPVEPPKPPEITLKGVILDSAGEYVAYIEVDKAKPVPMRKGDKMENIELIGISGRRAVLKWNDIIMDLSLDKIKTIENPKAVK